jgi:hypothetical protein
MFNRLSEAEIRSGRVDRINTVHREEKEPLSDIGEMKEKKCSWNRSL